MSHDISVIPPTKKELKEMTKTILGDVVRFTEQKEEPFILDDDTKIIMNSMNREQKRRYFKANFKGINWQEVNNQLEHQEPYINYSKDHKYI